MTPLLSTTPTPMLALNELTLAPSWMMHAPDQSMPGSARLTFLPVQPTVIPPGVSLDDVIAAVQKQGGVDATQSKLAGLQHVVERAHHKGIQLSIVVIETPPGRDSNLRDLATEVGKHEGGTVLVLSPNWVGTYSTSFSRVQLEGAEDTAKWSSGQSVDAANKFLDALSQPAPHTSLITAGLLTITVIATGGLYAVKARRARREQAPGGDGAETPGRHEAPAS